MQRPTHFLALPLHHHSTLRTRVGAFQSGLLNHGSSPPIAGLDRSIVIDPRRLHLTLGVMALDNNNNTDSTDDNDTYTIETALALLHSLQPKVTQILQGAATSVKVRLDTLDVLKYDIVRSQGNHSVNAHVLFLGPSRVSDNEEDKRLWALCNLISESFKDAGFITETRPLKLHCTILNTSHRRPRSRLPFSYTDILSSPAYQSILSTTTTNNNNNNSNNSATSRTSVPVNFGTFDVTRVELWKMGSHGPNNEYITCGGLDIM